MLGFGVGEFFRGESLSKQAGGQKDGMKGHIGRYSHYSVFVCDEWVLCTMLPNYSR